METLEALKEKEAVRNLVGELAVTVLWQPETKEANGDTSLHNIHCYKGNDGIVICEIKKVR